MTSTNGTGPIPKVTRMKIGETPVADAATQALPVLTPAAASDEAPHTQVMAVVSDKAQAGPAPGFSGESTFNSEEPRMSLGAKVALFVGLPVTAGIVAVGALGFSAGQNERTSTEPVKPATSPSASASATATRTPSASASPSASPSPGSVTIVSPEETARPAPGNSASAAPTEEASPEAPSPNPAESLAAGPNPGAGPETETPAAAQPGGEPTTAPTVEPSVAPSNPAESSATSPAAEATPSPTQAAPTESASAPAEVPDPLSLSPQPTSPANLDGLSGGSASVSVVEPGRSGS